MSREGASDSLMSKEIIVVDDDPDFGELVRAAVGDVLGPQKHNVKIFGVGDIFLDYLDREVRKHKIPDLIFLDIVMPGLDGVAVARKLKALEGCGNIPIICATACTREDDRVREISAFSDDFLFKPFELDDLILKTRRALNLNKLNQNPNGV